MCLDLVPELSLGACCSDVRGDVLGGGTVGGRSERSTKIRKIRHIGRLCCWLVFFVCCVSWSNWVLILEIRSSLGS